MSIETSNAARQGYQWCRALAQSHYENFPVASRLLPRQLRDPIAAIYAFARTADDIADEGDIPRQLRLHRLRKMETALDAVEAGGADNTPLYQALADTIKRYRLPVDLFRDLLSAFQLINFVQDIDRDYRKNYRIYIPQTELQYYAVSEDDIKHRRNSAGFRQLMNFQIQRAAGLLDSGSPLGRQTRGRFGLELRAIILGGSRILEKLRQQDDLFDQPRLDSRDWGRIIWGAFKQTLI
jgi:phytoene/squalene synthetase